MGEKGVKVVYIPYTKRISTTKIREEMAQIKRRIIYEKYYRNYYGRSSRIGAEIVVKALNYDKIYNECIPVVYGDYEAIKDAIEFCHSNQRIYCIKKPCEAMMIKQ